MPVEPSGIQNGGIQFPISGVRLYCPRCKREEPHNPGTDRNWGQLPARILRYKIIQTLVVPYQCQGCTAEPVIFSIRRDNVKFQLVGRNPIEVTPTPDVIPELERKYFSDAVLAYQSGQVLPAIFMLRTFIEQVWKRYNTHFAVVLAPGAITAEERGARYQEALPDDFKQRFPSFLKIYADLSAAMHDADADSTLFEKTRGEIVEHFEARKLYKLSMPTPGESAKKAT